LTSSRRPLRPPSSIAGLFSKNTLLEKRPEAYFDGSSLSLSQLSRRGKILHFFSEFPVPSLRRWEASGKRNAGVPPPMRKRSLLVLRPLLSGMLDVFEKIAFFFSAAPDRLKKSPAPVCAHAFQRARDQKGEADPLVFLSLLAL